MKTTIIWIITILIVIIGVLTTSGIIMWVHIKSQEQINALDGALYGIFIYGVVWVARKFNKRFIKQKGVN